MGRRLKANGRAIGLLSCYLRLRAAHSSMQSIMQPQAISTYPIHEGIDGPLYFQWRSFTPNDKKPFTMKKTANATLDILICTKPTTVI
jgi:hypothetical protein